MVLTFLSSIWIQFVVMIDPKNLTIFMWNLHLSDCSLMSAFCKALKTFLTFCMCSFKVLLVYINMSSRYAVTNMSRYLQSVVLIRAWKVAGAFVSPNGITVYL